MTADDYSPQPSASYRSKMSTTGDDQQAAVQHTAVGEHEAVRRWTDPIIASDDEVASMRREQRRAHRRHFGVRGRWRRWRMIRAATATSTTDDR